MREPVSWIVGKEWAGERAFIVCGGPSVAQQNLSLLKGKRVVVLNSSYLTVPHADILFFADFRWWFEHMHRAELKAFTGRIVTCSPTARQSNRSPALRHLRRVNPPPALSKVPTDVVCNKTSLQGAINMIVHLGANSIALLGADMCRAPDGKSHHHEPHPWPNRSGNVSWDEQLVDLAKLEHPLRSLGIEVLNLSPVSRITWWQKCSLEDAVR